MLKKSLLGLSSLLFIIAAYAAEDNECLHGKIVAADTRQPLEGVIVYTEHLPDTVKTNAQGEFKFERCVSVRNPFNKNFKEGEQFIRGNKIFFIIKEPEAFVKLNIYNLAGRVLRSIVNKKLSANSYSFKLPLKEISTSVSVCIVNLQIGSKSFTQQIVLGKDGILNSGKIKSSQDIKINRDNRSAQFPIDSLYIEKTNFDRIIIPIYSYKGRLDTALVSQDTVPPILEKFSWPDTAWFEIRDSIATKGGWLKFWFNDSIKANVKFSDDRGEVLSQPSTNTSISHSLSGFYSISFVGRDLAMNTVGKTILLILYDSTIIDTVPPILTVIPETLIVSKGDKIVLDTGVTVKDEVDTHIVNWREYLNITDDIKSTKERYDFLNRTVILDIPGTYTVTYKIIDTHKNLAEKKRIIIVKDTEGSGGQ
ncbi:MAG: DUF5011 domain-containing protein [Chitinispirillaceae bacterium]|nr:DUF5011 domain-containing protein [Chitinispirillaceae bacterium]